MADAITAHHIKGMFDAGDQPGSAPATANVQGDLIESVDGDPVTASAMSAASSPASTPGDEVRVSGLQLVPNNPYDLGNATNVNVKISANNEGARTAGGECGAGLRAAAAAR